MDPPQIEANSNPHGLALHKLIEKVSNRKSLSICFTTSSPQPTSCLCSLPTFKPHLLAALDHRHRLPILLLLHFRRRPIHLQLGQGAGHWLAARWSVRRRPLPVALAAILAFNYAIGCSIILF